MGRNPDNAVGIGPQSARPITVDGMVERFVQSYLNGQKNIGLAEALEPHVLARLETLREQHPGASFPAPDIYAAIPELRPPGSEVPVQPRGLAREGAIFTAPIAPAYDRGIYSYDS